MKDIILLFGGIDTLFSAFLVLIVIDYLTGVLNAIYNHKLNSDIGSKGIIRKIGYLSVIVVSQVIDNLYNSNLNIRDILLYMFISNELLSILENIDSIGIKIPIKIKNILLNNQENNK